MNQIPELQRIAEKLQGMEAELHTLRRELTHWIEQQPRQGGGANTDPLAATFDRLFETLGIKATSIGPEALQERMRQESIGETTEFSEALIRAREE